MTAAQLAGLPEHGATHREPHGTETAAALGIAPHTRRLRERVLTLLREAGPVGLTDDEGGRALGGDRLDFGRRRHELARAGLVVDSGQRRRTPHGRFAIVWRAS